VNAALILGAPIIGTGVIVVAINLRTSLAPTIGTGVILGTTIAVAARLRVGGVRTASLSIARIVGTRVVVIARQSLSSDTISQMAVVAGSAQVIVIARHRIQFKNATGGDVATVRGTRVFIITNERIPSRTLTRFTAISLGTDIAIIAITLRGEMVAATFGLAGIGRASIAVVATQQIAGSTLTSLTVVIGSTSVAVVTGAI